MTGDANLLEEGETSHPLKKVKILEQIDENWSKEDLQKLLKGIQEFGADWYKSGQKRWQ